MRPAPAAMLTSTYTYPSSTKGKLPFSHAKFRGGQTPNPWRYYHGHPSRLGHGAASRRGDAPLPQLPAPTAVPSQVGPGARQERTFYTTVWGGEADASVKLPRLEAIHCRQRRSTSEKRSTFNQYIQDFKARFRIKGLDTSKVYGLTRGHRRETVPGSKPEPSKRQPKTTSDTGGLKGPVRQRSLSLPALFLQEGRQGSDLSDVSVTTGVSSVAFSDVNQDLKLRLNAKLEDDIIVPGFRSRGRERRRRRLGGIMTSERLVELLEDDEKTLPYTYYKTTIVGDPGNRREKPESIEETCEDQTS